MKKRTPCKTQHCYLCSTLPRVPPPAISFRAMPPDPGCAGFAIFFRALVLVAVVCLSTAGPGVPDPLDEDQDGVLSRCACDAVGSFWIPCTHSAPHAPPLSFPPSLDHSMDNCPSVFNPDQEHTWAPRQPGAVGDACTTKGEFSPQKLQKLPETDKLWKA